MSSDSSTLSSNQLFGSSVSAAQDEFPLGFGSSLRLPARENRARPVSFSVDSILADDAAPQTSMMSKKVKEKKKKQYKVEKDPPDFFSSMVTGM